MKIGSQDSICSTRQPSKSIDLIVTDKPLNRMPHRVIEPPDGQCSNLMATEQNISVISYYWEQILLLVLKNAMKIPNGKCMENFLKPWLIDNICFAKKLWVKLNFIKIQFFTNKIFPLLTEYQLKFAFLLRICKIKVQN